VITAHLTPQQRATYEKINHLRHKHTTFITEREDVEKQDDEMTRLPDEDVAANVTLDNDRLDRQTPLLRRTHRRREEKIVRRGGEEKNRTR